MSLIRELYKIALAVLAAILILVGAVNLKNYHEVFSIFELTYGSFFVPLMWVACIGLGVYIGAKYVKMEFRS